jgi:hypothetical protein
VPGLNVSKALLTCLRETLDRLAFAALRSVHNSIVTRIAKFSGLSFGQKSSKFTGVPSPKISFYGSNRSGDRLVRQRSWAFSVQEGRAAPKSDPRNQPEIYSFSGDLFGRSRPHRTRAIEFRVFDCFPLVCNEVLIDIGPQSLKRIGLRNEQRQVFGIELEVAGLAVVGDRLAASPILFGCVQKLGKVVRFSFRNPPALGFSAGAKSIACPTSWAKILAKSASDAEMIFWKRINFFVQGQVSFVLNAKSKAAASPSAPTCLLEVSNVTSRIRMISDSSMLPSARRTLCHNASSTEESRFSP